MTKVSTDSSSNGGFIRALLASFSILSLSALLLVVGFLLIHSDRLEGWHESKALILDGRAFKVTVGYGVAEKTALVLKALQRGNAVVTKRNILFKAVDYPVLSVHVEGRHPGVDVAFYWVRADDFNTTYHAVLPWNGDAPLYYRLDRHANWKGRIVEFGLSIRGALREKPMIVERIALRPYDPPTLLAVVWSEWFAYEPWRQHSINAILGVTKEHLVSPVVAAALWVGVGLTLFFVWKRGVMTVGFVNGRRGSSKGVPSKKKEMFMVTALLLVPWFFLDGKWQLNLWRQHEETWYSFSGRSHREQHLAAEDAVYFHFANQLKPHLAQNDSGRIFILQDGWQDYGRLRMLYYLLPYNVYPFGRQPNPRYVQRGDFILALNPLSNVIFDKSAGVLRWGKRRALRVRLLSETSSGRLFQVVEDPVSAKKRHDLSRE